jgi:hypothetical protein
MKYILSAALTTLVAVAFEGPPSWYSEGWRADFRSGTCTLSHTYAADGDFAYSLFNMMFVRTHDVEEFNRDEYPLPVIVELLESGEQGDQLTFQIAAPYPDDVRGIEVPRTVAFKVEGMLAEGPVFDEDPVAAWFYLREPESARLLQELQAGDRVTFKALTDDGGALIFDYEPTSRTEFRVRMAQFKACSDALMLDESFQEPSGAPGA